MKGRTRLLLCLIVAVYTCGIAAQRKECENATVADIVFLVDGSSSIGTKSFEEVRRFLRRVIDTVDIGADKVRIGLAQYSDEPFREFLLKDHTDKNSLLAEVDRFPYRGGGTETGKAINFLWEQYFTEEAGSRASQRVPQIAVVITDGDSTDDVKAPAQSLRQHGVIVFAIGVGQLDKTKLESIANWPPNRFLFTINNYEALQALTDSLLKIVCVSMDDQRRALEEKFADIFFLVDSGIAPAQLTTIRSDLIRLINQGSVGESAYRFGLAQYGQDVNVEFNLNTYQTKQDILGGVRRFRPRPQPNRPRLLGNALEYANTHFFTREAGGRAHQGTPQYLVLLIGDTTVDASTIARARVIISEGKTVVGMSAGASMDVIDVLSSYGYAVDSSRLSVLKDLVMTEKREAVTEECKGANVADLVFVVDESGSITTPNFQLIRSFLHSFVKGLDVGWTKVRVGIVTYSDAPTAQVYLDTFNNQAEILQYINMLPYRGGGTKTGSALQLTHDEVFTERRGSRKGVQKVAIVITDGVSSDNVSAPARSLRQAGVTVYAIGIKGTDGANETELEAIASHPPYKYVFVTDDFTKLSPLRQSLQKTLCNDIIEQVIDDRKDCLKDEADIFFLMDDSGSIEHNDFDDMKKFIFEFIKSFRIGPQHVRMGIVKYSDKPYEQFGLTAHSTADELTEAVKKIKHIGGGTNTGKALSTMLDRFADNRRVSVPEYLIVITDGKSADPVKGPAEKLRAQNIQIFAIGVKEANRTELKQIAGDPMKTSLVTSFDALKSISKGIIRDICTPEECKDVQSDVFFLTDSSESISEPDFQKMKEFMKAIIRKSAVGQNQVHFGLMQFSTSFQLEFRLDRFYSQDEMVNAIDAMQQMNEGTRTGRAIRAVSPYFDKTNGGRPEVKQKLIVITDGQAKDEVRGPAADLRDKHVTIFAIGLVDANNTQLVEISGSPDRVYNERNFDALSEVQRKIPLELCRPEECERSDMIFLVDVSSSINSAEFESMKTFLKAVVERTTVGKDLTRFGVILYSTNPNSIFTLKDYDSKRKVLEEISNLKPLRGKTFTSKALKYSLEFFDDKHGGRKKRRVPQILMVITDGRAQDRDDLKATSDALRDQGVIIFSIGVGNAAQDQLNTMAGNDPSKVFHVENYGALGAKINNIAHAVCNATKPVCKNDLVLLLDRSGSIKRKDYNIMLNFTSELVKSFKLGEEFMHVGLAQFSTYLKDEFYLNTTYDKDDMIDHISKMELKGGGTKIGVALAGIENYFKVSSGSRKGVPKNLLLITDGDSEDDVEDPAEQLRSRGINVFSIGVGDIHDLQLLQICGTPERMFNVWTFENMIKVKQKLIDEMCKTEPPEDECSIDIAFGFDISRTPRTPDEILVSEHNKLQTFLPVIARSVSSARSLCCTGSTPVETNIAFHVVDRDGRSLYDTRFEGYSEDVMKKVMTLPMSQPTYFNTALLKYFKEKFKDEERAKVKVVVIFSDGLDEEVMKVEEESELLRQSGVSALLTVALQGAHDPAQLQMVEFGRGFGYKPPLSIGMQSVGSTMIEQIDTVSSRECCNVMCKCSGHEGSPGPMGRPGEKGNPGLKGQPGHPGDEGISGERGPPGPDGPPGIQGCPGARGQKGYRGVSGDRGEDGEDGVDGVDGEQGVTGQDGARGERGHPGDSGIPGIRGETGLKGDKGLRGDPGPPGADNTVPGAKGDPGNPGLPGPPGRDGRPGTDGVPGDLGPDGRRGDIGEKGAPGGPGGRGFPGIPGAQGPQGRRGGNGEPGPKGISGFPGRQGEPGPAGDPGAAGRRGPNGQKGQPGEPGVKGAPGSQGPRGMPGQDGKDGYGPSGPKGAKGDPGFPGYPGPPGQDGVEGTKGYPGRKGNQGRGGDSGEPGGPGSTGGDGYPGRRGPKGPPGERHTTECELITFIRDNCACSSGENDCPVYPTELVFALDMSEGVTSAVFERQRSALLSLLEDITVAESNCPTGARVAVMGYNTDINYLIRFQDYRSKKALTEAVKNIAMGRSPRQRQLGAAMRFVGQNVFKRVRAGVRMRKVAVFFTNGPSQDSPDIVTAMMEYQALNIVPAVIALRNVPPISRAMEVDDTGKSIFTVLGSDLAELWKVKTCAICYDPCRPSTRCNFIQEPVQPQEADVDLVMVVDSSREMQADEYAGAQQLLVSVVEQLAVSQQPSRAGNQARVAVVQQSATRVIKPEFGLQKYQNQALMRRHLIQTMRQQGGTSALGQTLDFTLREVLLKATQPRRRRALMTVVGTQTANKDRAKLHYISQKAKCEGVAMFVVTVGNRYNRTQVEELASLPVQQHLIHMDRLKAIEQGYAQRFFRVFLTALNKGMNMYPPPAVKRTCALLADPDEALFTNGQGSAEPDEEMLGDEAEPKMFVEETGGETQMRQLDVVNTSTREDDQSSPSGGHLNGACLLPRDHGNCKNTTIMWFFNSERGRCFPFWYSGCGGNENRFETVMDCEKLCQASRAGGKL